MYKKIVDSGNKNFINKVAKSSSNVSQMNTVTFNRFKKKPKNFNRKAINEFKILNELKNIARNHTAVQNKFYFEWENRKLQDHEIEIFLANFFARTINTVARVFDVMKKLIDPVRMLEDENYRNVVAKNMKNVADELGNYNSKEMHLILLKEWCNTFLEKINSPLYPIEKNYVNYLTEETRKFCKKQEEIYNHQSINVVIGASFAQEFIADIMLNKINNGYIKNYNNLFDSTEDLYKSTKYFGMHVFGAEEEHAELTSDLIKCLCKEDKDFHDLKYGFNTFLEITANYWQGIYNKLNVHNDLTNTFHNSSREI